MINLEVEVYDKAMNLWVPKISLILKTDFEKINMIGIKCTQGPLEVSHKKKYTSLKCTSQPLKLHICGHS